MIKCLVFTNRIRLSATFVRCLDIDISIMDFSWALPYPEIYKICTLFQLTEVSNPVKYVYKSLKSIIQDGPKCGLVALAMCMENVSDETVNVIVESAKDKRYTYNGEMFSVNEMANLAKDFLENSNVHIFNDDLNCEYIKQFLLDGGLILVPYDTGRDNSPGLFKGHKAHWAIICGAIQTNNDFFVIARHGKAKNVAIWKLNTLAESNKQLLEFSPDRKLQNIEYKLPDGGINGPLGLKNKSVLIQLS